MNSQVYLIHFETAYHHAQHYIGSTIDLEARIEDHRSGRGARLMEVITEANINFKVARTWKGDRKNERHLKKQKNARKFCPDCSDNPRDFPKKRRRKK